MTSIAAQPLVPTEDRPLEPQSQVPKVIPMVGLLAWGPMEVLEPPGEFRERTAQRPVELSAWGLMEVLESLEAFEVPTVHQPVEQLALAPTEGPQPSAESAVPMAGRRHAALP